MARCVDVDVEDCLLLGVVVRVGSLALLCFPLGDILETHGQLAQRAGASGLGLGECEACEARSLRDDRARS